MIEFSHPRTAATSDGAKIDALDAVRAAREVLGRAEAAIPRARGRREALRALETTRRGAQTARTAAINELEALIISAPVDLRDQLRGLTTTAQIAACAAFACPQNLSANSEPPNKPSAATPGASKPSPARSPTCRRRYVASSRSSPPNSSTSPASAQSAPHRSTSPGRTPAGAATKPPSPASPASRPSKPPAGRTPATGSAAAATANSTGPCTPSPSPASEPAPHQRGRRQQTRISHQRLIIEDHPEPIQTARYSTHRKCLPTLGRSRCY